MERFRLLLVLFQSGLSQHWSGPGCWPDGAVWTGLPGAASPNDPCDCSLCVIMVTSIGDNKKIDEISSGRIGLLGMTAY